MRPVVTTAARGSTTAVLCPSARFTRHVCGSGFFGQPPLAGHDPSLSPEVPEERPGQGWERAAEPAAQLTTTEPQRRSLRGRFSRTRRIGTCSPKHSWPWVELAVSDDETGRREGHGACDARPAGCAEPFAEPWPPGGPPWHRCPEQGGEEDRGRRQQRPPGHAQRGLARTRRPRQGDDPPRPAAARSRASRSSPSTSSRPTNGKPVTMAVLAGPCGRPVFAPASSVGRRYADREASAVRSGGRDG
jgi:hypothetical protein